MPTKSKRRRQMEQPVSQSFLVAILRQGSRVYGPHVLSIQFHGQVFEQPQLCTILGQTLCLTTSYYSRPGSHCILSAIVTCYSAEHGHVMSKLFKSLKSGKHLQYELLHCSFQQSLHSRGSQFHRKRLPEAASRKNR